MSEWVWIGGAIAVYVVAACCLVYLTARVRREFWRGYEAGARAAHWRNALDREPPS